MDSGKKEAASGAAWERFLDWCESAIYGFFKWTFIAGFIVSMLAIAAGAFTLHWALGIIVLWIVVGITAAYFGK